MVACACIWLQKVTSGQLLAAGGCTLKTRSTIAMQAAMDGASFAKLCRDSGLLRGKLNTTAVDIAFSKAKAKVGQHPK